MLCSIFTGTAMNLIQMFERPCQFPVQMKELGTEPADALFPAFHRERFKVENKMTACVCLTQSRARGPIRTQSLQMVGSL